MHIRFQKAAIDVRQWQRGKHAEASDGLGSTEPRTRCFPVLPDAKLLVSNQSPGAVIDVSADDIPA
jgi:hypothetical protein